MSTTTTTPSLPYRMPPVAVGMTVLWFPDMIRLNSPAAAIVTDVGTVGISLTVFPPDSRQGTPRSGVRHATDPGIKGLLDQQSGCWDFTYESKRLQDGLAVLAS